jgi:hypothetical protein
MNYYTTYVNGYPLYWQHEQTGLLRRAIEYYVNCCCGDPHSTDEVYHQEQIDTVRLYFRSWIYATIWEHDPAQSANLNRLRSQIQTATTISDLIRWQQAALDQGIDPL